MKYDEQTINATTTPQKITANGMNEIIAAFIYYPASGGTVHGSLANYDGTALIYNAAYSGYGITDYVAGNNWFNFSWSAANTFKVYIIGK